MHSRNSSSRCIAPSPASNTASFLRSHQKRLWRNIGRLSWRKGEGCCSIGYPRCYSIQILEDVRLCEAGCSIESRVIGIAASDPILWHFRGSSLFCTGRKIPFAGRCCVAPRRFGRVLSITRHGLYGVILLYKHISFTLACACTDFTLRKPLCLTNLSKLAGLEGTRYATHQRALMGSTCAGGQRILATPSSFSASASFLSEEEEDDLETLPGR